MAKFLQKAIKHPGALTRAAQEHGVSKRAEAEKESHSSNPHIRARGVLGKRLMSGGDLHHGSSHHRTRHEGDGHHSSAHHGGMHHHTVNIHFHGGKSKHFKI